MEDSSGSGFESENAGDTSVFSIMLPVRIAEWIERTAHRKNKTTEQFLRELVLETFDEQTEPLDVRIRRINELIKEIVVLASKMPMQEEKDAKTGSPAFELRKKKRDQLVELGMEAYDELRKISASEQVAKESEFRLQAFTVMARIGAFNAAVIRDQEAEDLALLIDELQEGNDRLEAEIKELTEGQREEEAVRRALI